MHIDGAFNRNNMRYHGVLSDGFVKSGFGKMSQRQPTEFSYGLDDNSYKLQRIVGNRHISKAMAWVRFVYKIH